MDSSDEDDFGLPPMKHLASDDDSSEDESYADLFRTAKKKPPVGFANDPEDSYVPPTRSHVCDECEEVFEDAVFCGECSMTYCLPCDARYHSGDAALTSHYRQSLSGEVPRNIARHMEEIAREEQEAAEEYAERMTRPSVYADTDRGREPEPQPPSSRAPASVFDTDYAGLPSAPQPQPTHKATVSFDAQARSPSARSAPRGSPPPPADAWGSVSAASPSYPPSSSFSYAAMPSPPPAQEWFGSTASTDIAGTMPRPAAAKKPRPASASARTSAGAVPRSMMVLKSSRPPPAVSASSAYLGQGPSSGGGGGRPLPTRMSVANSFTTLPAKGHKNLLLHSASAAMVHEVLPRKKRSTTGERGAHARPAGWGDHPKTAGTLRELNQTIMALKQEIAAGEKQRAQMKTAVLKKQRALKEIARIATNLAKQPNAPVPPASSTASDAPRKPPANASAEVQALHAKVETLRTSNEILRLECEQLEERMGALRAHDEARTTGAQDLAALERERLALIQHVSVASAGRELDTFKRAQMVADLTFALGEMEKTKEAKRQALGEQRMAKLAAENQTEAMQREYQLLQEKLDRLAERQIGGGARY